MSERLNNSTENACGLTLLARIQHLSITSDWHFDETMEEILEDIGKSLGFSRCWILHLRRISTGDLVHNWEYCQPSAHVDKSEQAEDRVVVFVDMNARVAAQAQVATQVRILIEQVRLQCSQSRTGGFLIRKNSIVDAELASWQLLWQRHVESAYLLPLLVSSNAYGEPSCNGILILEPASDSNLDVVMALANHLALFIDNRDLNAQVDSMKDRDEMTGLSNRRQFQKDIRQELRRALFFTDCFSVAHVNIDFLKRINDFHGFAAGDATVLAIAELIEAGCRSVDSVARCGGNEFQILMPCMNKKAAQIQIEHIRDSVCKHPIPNPNGDAFTATATFGISSFPEDGADWDSLRRVAEIEVVLSKRAGRNRVGCQTKQCRDDRDQLHCADGPAVVFSDGYNLYCWHGTFVSEDIILHPQAITVELIEKESNLEVRRVLLERYGLSRYLEDTGADKIGEDEWGVLFRKVIPNDEPIVMVKVINATPELDGTRKAYFLRVPPTIESPHAAVAWSFGLEADEYRPKQES